MTEPNNSVKKLLRDFRLGLSDHYPEKEILEFVYILADDILGWPKTALHSDPLLAVPDGALVRFHQALEELQAGKPIQYVTGTCWFNDTLLRVGPGVLIPRPETAELCSLVKREHLAAEGRELSILDIGTGSGCIAIDLKKHWPGARVTAIDISEKALEYAAANASANRCEITFIRASILERAELENTGLFDLFVTNPPYVTHSEKALMHKNVTDFEPHEALFVPDDDPLLFCRAALEFAASHGTVLSCLYMEINERFGKAVCELAGQSGFTGIRLLQDIHGKDRFVVASSRGSR